MYGCGLSVTCVLQGSKPMDLCNGGMIWSCCVPRERVNEISAAGAGLIDNPSKKVLLTPIHEDVIQLRI